VHRAPAHGFEDEQIEGAADELEIGRAGHRVL
jgi:hypothetical protein